ncbi:MAG: twitching motility protein PilT [Lachnospiraceae bacterium]|nr:twitching motility protein PilT [Lachnospiraceae bacterium]
MVQIIAGTKGKGKTKILLEKANSAIKEAKGSVVYLDKNTKHMYELNNKVRLINVMDYSVKSCEAFVGFICGIVAQDHDLEIMFLDSFLKLAYLEGQDITDTIVTLDEIGKKYGVDFVISVSMDKKELTDTVLPFVSDAL